MVHWFKTRYIKEVLKRLDKLSLFLNLYKDIPIKFELSGVVEKYNSGYRRLYITALIKISSSEKLPRRFFTELRTICNHRLLTEQLSKVYSVENNNVIIVNPHVALPEKLKNTLSEKLNLLDIGFVFRKISELKEKQYIIPNFSNWLKNSKSIYIGRDMNKVTVYTSPPKRITLAGDYHHTLSRLLFTDIISTNTLILADNTKYYRNILKNHKTFTEKRSLRIINLEELGYNLLYILLKNRKLAFNLLDLWLLIARKNSKHSYYSRNLVSRLYSHIVQISCNLDYDEIRLQFIQDIFLDENMLTMGEEAKKLETYGKCLQATRI